jgi:hypothetical protein
MARRQFQDVFYDVLVSVQSVNIPSTPANSIGAVNATVPGAAVGDLVLFNSFGPWSGLGINARVSAPDTVAFALQNPTAGALDPAAATFVIVVLKVRA